MNKSWYDDYGNPFKIHFRKHHCYKCGSRLSICEHRRIVSRKSPESRHYFVGKAATMVGDCEFFHKVFFCKNCGEMIEFETQTSLEDVDIAIKKTVLYFRKRERVIQVSKYYVNANGVNETQFSRIEQVENLLLLIQEGNKCFTYRVPIKRRKKWARPYFFDVTKRKLIKFIKKQIV